MTKKESMLLPIHCERHSHAGYGVSKDAPCPWCEIERLTRERDALQIELDHTVASHTHEPSVTRLLVPGSRMARLSDIADSLVREMRRQGMEALQAVFDGMKVRVEPWQDPPERTSGNETESHK